MTLWANIKRLLRFGRNDDDNTAEELPQEPLPMFYVGDRVHIYNPHTGALFYEEYALHPSTYSVLAVKYDINDEVFRYLLNYEEAGGLVFSDGYGEKVEPQWIAEEWLSLPFHAEFAKSEVPKDEAEDYDEPTPEMREVERKIISQAMDEFAERNNRIREIDRLLDVMNEGTEEERKEAGKELQRLTTEGKSNGNV